MGLYGAARGCVGLGGAAQCELDMDKAPATTAVSCPIINKGATAAVADSVLEP